MLEDAAIGFHKADLVRKHADGNMSEKIEALLYMGNVKRRRIGNEPDRITLTQGVHQCDVLFNRSKYVGPQTSQLLLVSCISGDFLQADEK